MPQVSIIMPVRNRPDLTRQAIDSLLANIGTKDYEMIVVDDASDDPQTHKYLDSLEFNVRVKVLRMAAQTHHGACCNAGVSISSGHFLYIADNDTYYLPNWLPALLDAKEAFPEVGILGGDRHPWHGVDRRETRSGITVEFAGIQVGYSMLLTRSLWNKIGPFCHDPLHLYGNDDTQLCERCIAHGQDIASLFPRVVYHCGITKTNGEAALGAKEFLAQGAPKEVIYA